MRRLLLVMLLLTPVALADSFSDSSFDTSSFDETSFDFGTGGPVIGGNNDPILPYQRRRRR